MTDDDRKVISGDVSFEIDDRVEERLKSFDADLEYSGSFEIGSVVERYAVEELLDGDEYHAVGVTPETVGRVLQHVRDMVHELRRAGYLSSGDEAGVIAASTQLDDAAEDGEPTAMQLIEDAFDDHARVPPSSNFSGRLHVEGVPVHGIDELPPGVVVAVAADALAPTLPIDRRPFIVRDRRGVETRHLKYVGDDASDD